MSGRWRWWGFGGAVLIAFSATIAGALPSHDPGEGFRTGTVAAPFAVGLLLWVAGGVLLTVAWWRSQSTDLTTGVLWALPFLLAPPLGSRDVYAYACQGWVWLHGQDPYAVGVAEGGCPWAQSVPQLWWETPTPYGPLAVALSGLAAAMGSQLAAVLVLRLIALAAAIVLAWQLPRLAVLCGASPAIALRFGLITPLVLVHGISGAHNDLLIAALVVAALASAREKAALAGLLIAAAVAIKVTAIVALPFVLLLNHRRWFIGAGTAVLSFAAMSLATGLGLGWISALRNTGELAQWSSVPTAVGMTIGYLLRPFGISGDLPIAVARAAGLLALAAIAIFLLRKAWQQRDSAREVVVACGLLLAATAILGPVFYPWYALTPLAVLAASKAPPKALVVICTFLTLPNGLGIPVLTKAVGAFAVTAALVVMVIRRRRPAPAA